MDDVLPLPAADWDNPQPCDAPTPEEVDTFAVLRRVAEGLPLWLTIPATQGANAHDWQDLADRLTEIAQQCAACAADAG